MRFVRGAGAALALVALVLGVPFALSVGVGWPLPRSVPGWTQITTTFTQPGVPDAILLDALAVVCWIAWTVVMVSLATEIVAVARGRSAPRLRYAGPLQMLVGSLVATMILTVVATSDRTTVSGDHVRVAQPSIRPKVAVVTPDPGKQVPRPTTLTTATPRVQTLPTNLEYQVQPRDNLWGIAEIRLGNPLRWREIFDLNRGRPQPDGDTLAEARLIRPGWVLELPVVVAPSAAPTPEMSSATVSSPAASAASAPTSEPSPATGRERTPNPASSGHVAAGTSHAPAVALPDGSIVGLGLAAGVGAALAGAR